MTVRGYFHEIRVEFERESGTLNFEWICFGNPDEFEHVRISLLACSYRYFNLNMNNNIGISNIKI